ncbi:hypothetical protein PG995_015441 [Apiospora arundinis]|uniref:protein-tyrosine-phosphatase n=1 Tax=Apiospora arundinis TaxID=335852 RepID=A0ABR2IG81_9PEZI
MALDRIPGKDNLYVGGVFALRKPDLLQERNIDHVLSVIKYSFEGWGEEAKKFQHLSIDVDDMEDEDLLVHFSSAVRFIDRGLYPPGADHGTETSPGSVFVHCAMGKSRSVSCAIAYLLYKYPHRYGGKQFEPSAQSAAQRRGTAKDAIEQALKQIKEARSLAEPNPGFMRQLELWWEMGCPADSDGAVESHPIYQKWLYERKLEESRAAHMAPEAEWIRFEDEASEATDQPSSTPSNDAQRELRCKKCRRVLANSKFIIEHGGTGNEAKTNAPCGHVFVETLSWMRPALEEGALDGRLSCPNTKCGAQIGRFAWQGLRCSCREWVCPAFSLNRSRVDESDRSAGSSIRMPPRSGSL